MFIVGAALTTAKCNFDRRLDLPVPECEALDRALSACTHQPSAIARQPSALPKTAHEQQRLAELCAANLDRVHRSCH
jgi:hypothetical protein